MSVLPATGSAITMGRTYTAYYNATPTAGTNVSLNNVLGSKISKGAGTSTPFSSSFGGRTAPYTY